MAKRPVYMVIASKLQAMVNCDKMGNTEWRNNHLDAISKVLHDHMPSGSGFDCGTGFRVLDSTPERLVFSTSFHHMNEHGSYDGWTEHKVIVTPSLANGFNLRVTGRDRNGIKEYIGDLFHEYLSVEVEEYS